MYNIRYHLASLMSVFFALAIGLILGGLIAERAPENIHEALLEGIERDIALARESNEQLRADNIVANEFADMLLADYLQDKLDERVILVLGARDREVERVMSSLEYAGATAVAAVPEFDRDAGGWSLQSDYDLQELEFSGVVTVFEPTGADGETLRGYFTFLQILQENHDVSVIFASIVGEESDIVASAWEEGFSGTNQLGNRYGFYALVVLLASDTEGEFGDSETAYALYPQVPDVWILATEAEENELSLEGEEVESPENETP